jgi:hypothetical protein
MNPDLAKLEEDSFYEDDYSEVPPPEIVAYNELRSCADLFRMHSQKILDIQPDFQRDVVWKASEQTRFIDSLIKQLPIPSMCFAMDHRAQKWIVIDGLQRISTIIRFLEGGDWRLSKLDDIDPSIAGKSVAAIKTDSSSLHEFYTRVENLSIPVTVLRCDFRKRSHLDYLFTIFHRLNTGGVKLNNQEIRNCIYGGSFNQLLKNLDQYPKWRKLNRMTSTNSYRFIKQEVILRFFAFHDQFEGYTGHLAKFLNDYFHDNRHAKEDWINSKGLLFQQTIDYISKNIFSTAPSKFPNTILEALLVGVGSAISKNRLPAPRYAETKFKKLIGHSVFSEEARKEGLSKKPKVIERMRTAIEIFCQ